MEKYSSIILFHETGLKCEQTSHIQADRHSVTLCYCHHPTIISDIILSTHLVYLQEKSFLLYLFFSAKKKKIILYSVHRCSPLYCYAIHNHKGWQKDMARIGASKNGSNFNVQENKTKGLSQNPGQVKGLSWLKCYPHWLFLMELPDLIHPAFVLRKPHLWILEIKHGGGVHMAFLFA